MDILLLYVEKCFRIYVIFCVYWDINLQLWWLLLSVSTVCTHFDQCECIFSRVPAIFCFRWSFFWPIRCCCTSFSVHACDCSAIYARVYFYGIRTQLIHVIQKIRMMLMKSQLDRMLLMTMTMTMTKTKMNQTNQTTNVWHQHSNAKNEELKKTSIIHFELVAFDLNSPLEHTIPAIRQYILAFRNGFVHKWTLLIRLNEAKWMTRLQK